MKTVGLWLACLSVAGMVAAKGKGDEAKGKVVFQQCMMCHRGDSTDKKIGPGLKGAIPEGEAAQREEAHGADHPRADRRGRRWNASV